jgi:tetratricopeptide (TPR) repeat protein
MKTLLIGLVVVLPWAAWAGGELDKARAAYDEMDFEVALEAAGQALAAPDAEPEDLVGAYRLRGLCLSGLGNVDGSVMAFRRLLSIRPDFKLSADISPKLAAPYYQAVAMSREIKPITLHHRQAGPRADQADRELVVVLEADPLRLVKAVRLRFRTAGAEWSGQATVPVAEPGSFRLDLAPAAGPQVEYYFEALTAAGGVITRLGSRQQAYQLSLAALSGPGPVAAGLVDADREPLSDLPDDRPAVWYKTWWFWTAVGVVVVGGSVGLGVGLASGGGDGSVDYIIEVQ